MLQTVAPNVAKVSGRTDANAAVLGSLACLLDTPEWNGVPQRRRTRVPAGEVVLEVDVPSFTEQASTWPSCQNWRQRSVPLLSLHGVHGSDDEALGMQL